MIKYSRQDPWSWGKASLQYIPNPTDKTDEWGGAGRGGAGWGGVGWGGVGWVGWGWGGDFS